MKLLTSLFFTAYCMLFTLNASETIFSTATDKSTQFNASETFPKNPTTAISIGTTTVEIPRDNVSQTNIDLSSLKFCSALCAVMWTNLLINCYSECSQINYLNIVVGYSSAHTFDSALTYFKLNWLPQKLTLSNLTPHAALVATTALFIVLDAYKLYYLSAPVLAFCSGVLYSFLLELQDRHLEMRKTQALSN